MKNNHKNIIKIIVVFAAIAVLSVFLTQFISKENKKKEFKEMCNDISTSIAELIPPHFEDDDIVTNVECNISSSIEFNYSENWYDWNEEYHTNIYVDDSFDNLDEHEQYEIIDNLGRKAIDVIKQEIVKKYPRYEEYKKIDVLRDEIFGKYVFSDLEVETNILTSENTYEYATNLDNYFVKNGKDVFIRDENGNWDDGGSSSAFDKDDKDSGMGGTNYTGNYDATLEYGSGSVLVCISEDAMDRYMTALVEEHQGTIDEMISEGEVAWTDKGTKCNIVDSKLTKCKVKLLDGLYAGNTVWVVSESVHEINE